MHIMNIIILNIMNIKNVSNFCMKYNLFIYPISYKKNYPIPIVMETSPPPPPPPPSL